MLDLIAALGMVAEPVALDEFGPRPEFARGGNPQWCESADRIASRAESDRRRDR